MFKWRIENQYDNSNNGCAVSKNDFKTHRQAVNDLLNELSNERNQLKYSLGEQDRTKTIITVEECESETYEETRTPRIVEPPLELLQLVMYGNRNTGEADQAYEDLKRYLKEVKE